MKILRGCLLKLINQKHMITKPISILLCLFFVVNQYGFSQTDIVFEGIHISRSPTYPLKKIKTNLNKVSVWKDSMFLLEKSIDTLGSIKNDHSFFSTHCKSLIFKEINYVNRLFWNFNHSRFRLILSEIHFDKKEAFERAYFMLNRNMPRFELGMIGTLYFDWFKADGKIYFIQFNEILENEQQDDNFSLSKAKLKFQELLKK